MRKILLGSFLVGMMCCISLVSGTSSSSNIVKPKSKIMGSGYEAPENMVVVSNTEYQVAPGITENEIYLNNEEYTEQNVVHVMDVDLKGTSTTSIMASYYHLDGSNYHMSTTSSQAKYAAKQGFNVVGGINGSFYNMATGEPLGALIINGNFYHDADGINFFGIKKDGGAVIGSAADFALMKDDLQQAIGSPFTPLIIDGNVTQYSDYGLTMNYPRTCIGIRDDGSVVMIEDDGFRNILYSAGLSNIKVGELLKSYGCTSAAILDGGGSSTFVSKREGESDISVRNLCSDGSERTISSSLLVVSNAISDSIFDHAALAPNNKVYTIGSSVNCTELGADKAGMPAAIPSGVVWSVDSSCSSLGTIDADKGTFVSSGTEGTIVIYLSYENKIIGSTSFVICKPDKVYFKNAAVSLEAGGTSNLGLTVLWRHREVIYDSDDFIWTCSNSSLGTFDGLIFTANTGVNGTSGIVTCTYASDASIKASVEVEVGKPPVVLFDFEDRSNILATFGTAGTDTKGTLFNYDVVSRSSGEPVKFGNNSLKLNFDFSNSQAGTTLGAYVGPSYVNSAPTAACQIPGYPTAIGFWCYATEEAQGLWMRMSLFSDGGTTSNIPLNFSTEMASGIVNDGSYGINWIGWKYCEASLAGHDGPYTINNRQLIRLMELRSGQSDAMGKMTKGSIYIDNVRAVYGETSDDLSAPIIDAPMYSTSTVSNGVLGNGEIVKSKTMTITASFHDDTSDEHASGINYGNIGMSVDGIDYTDRTDLYSFTPSGQAFLKGIVLDNGVHVLRITIYDAYGNESEKMAWFDVEAADNDSSAIEVTGDSSAPILGHDYNLSVTSNDISNLTSFETTIQFNNYVQNLTVAFNEAIEGTYEFNTTLYRLTISGKKVDGKTPTTNVLATIAIPISASTKQGTGLVYSCVLGTFVTTKTVTSDSYLPGFGFAPQNQEIEATYYLTFDPILVSRDTDITVKDANGKVKSGVSIFINGELYGISDANGHITVNISDVKVLNIYATDGTNYSFVASCQSYDGAGNSDGTPSLVSFDGVEEASVSKNITWISNPLASGSYTVVQYCLHSDYQKRGEEAFISVYGAGSEYTFSGAGSISGNYIALIHGIKITGLKEGMTYDYRMGDGTSGHWSSIKTSVQSYAGGDTNFLVLGDVQTENFDNLTQILTEAVNSGLDYSFLIQTGDFVDSGNVYSYWNDTMGYFSSDKLMGSIDIIHTLGNHEFMGDQYASIASALYNYNFDSETNMYYSVTYGDVYIGVLSYTMNAAQLNTALTWLETDAQRTKAVWKILVMHQPPYYTNIDGSNETVHAIVPSFAEGAGFDFVFSGHDHSYARTLPLTDGNVDSALGVVYIISGSIGEKSYTATDNKDFHFASINGDYGSVYISVTATDKSFVMTAYDGTSGEVIDTYTKTNTKACATEGHQYVYNANSGRLVCSVDGYSIDRASYTGFVTEAITGQSIYLVSGEKANGFVVIGTDTYYFIEGSYLKGWQLIDGVYYQLDDSSGALPKDEVTITVKMLDGTLATFIGQKGKLFNYSLVQEAEKTGYIFSYSNQSGVLTREYIINEDAFFVASYALDPSYLAQIKDLTDKIGSVDIDDYQDLVALYKMVQNLDQKDQAIACPYLDTFIASYNEAVENSNSKADDMQDKINIFFSSAAKTSLLALGAIGCAYAVYICSSRRKEDL